MTEKDLPFALTAEDIMSILRIGRTKTYDLINSGEFPVRKIGNQKRIPRDTFLEWFYNKEAI